MDSSRLAPALLERVLERLGFSAKPDPTLEVLDLLYDTWCRRVPFDNVRKLIHLHEESSGPLPGDDPSEFFEAWLAHGTGGTCWASSNGLYALLEALGFQASRAVATMLVAPNLPPNHGTVIVDLDRIWHLVDTCMLHSEPFPLTPVPTDEPLPADTAPWDAPAPPWAIDSDLYDGAHHIRWRPLHKPDGLLCRIDYMDATDEDYRARHEETRPWSLFNYELYARLIKDDAVIGISRGQFVEFRDDGSVVEHSLEPGEHERLLIETFGIAESLVHRLPPDRPTPPPPRGPRGIAFS
jgi:arylamine N-acetyltransferase